MQAALPLSLEVYFLFEFCSLPMILLVKFGERTC
jgi:hypothetical protein